MSGGSGGFLKHYALTRLEDIMTREICTTIDGFIIRNLRGGRGERVIDMSRILPGGIHEIVNPQNHRDILIKFLNYKRENGIDI